MYRCNVCKVSLCKTPKTKSHNDKTCFTIWHSSVDLIVENKKIKAALRKKPNLDERSTNDNNSEEDNESSDNGDSNTQNDEEGDDDHSEPGEEEGQTSVTDENNNEEEGQTMDTDGNNDEEEDVEGERVHRYNTRSCTNLTGPFDFDQMASLSYAQFNNNRDSSDESDT
jgi:hypothetical protein